MKKIYSIVVLLFLIIASGYSQENLDSDILLKRVFNASEIKDLTILLDFFDSQVCRVEKADLKNISDSYQAFFKEMYERSKATFFEVNIPFDEQKEVYKKMNKSTFDKIWVFGKSWKHNSTDTLKRIQIYYYGAYPKFLLELSKEYDIIKGYYESYKDMGAMSPGMIASLLVNYQDYNTEDARIRLFIAIHYLTLNDQHKRKEYY